MSLFTGSADSANSSVTCPTVSVMAVANNAVHHIPIIATANRRWPLVGSKSCASRTANKSSQVYGCAFLWTVNQAEITSSTMSRIPKSHAYMRTDSTREPRKPPQSPTNQAEARAHACSVEQTLPPLKPVVPEVPETEPMEPSLLPKDWAAITASSARVPPAMEKDAETCRFASIRAGRLLPELLNTSLLSLFVAVLRMSQIVVHMSKADVNMTMTASVLSLAVFLVLARMYSLSPHRLLPELLSASLLCGSTMITLTLSIAAPVVLTRGSDLHLQRLLSELLNESSLCGSIMIIFMSQMAVHVVKLMANRMLLVASALWRAAFLILTRICALPLHPLPAQRSQLARMRRKNRWMKRLLLCSFVATSSASLDEDIQTGKTYMQLQPGVHNFSGTNVSRSLTIVGASVGNTTVQCSGAFSVTGALALYNLSITACKNCQLDTTIQASSGHISLENVNMQQSSLSCESTGSLWLRSVNITNVDISDHCQMSWNAGHADIELKITGTNPQVNITDVLLLKIYVSSGEYSNVRLLRVTANLELTSNPFLVLLMSWPPIVRIQVAHPLCKI